MSDPSLSRATLDTPKSGRNRRCPRCEMLAEQARERSLPPPVVREVESWTFQMYPYTGSRCRDCTDWEWSADWNTAHERAAGDAVERERLEHKRTARTASGRTYWKEARLQRAAKR